MLLTDSQLEIRLSDWLSVSNMQQLHLPIHSLSCVDVDECIGVKCGGKSVCFNGLNLYTCMCAEGWRGGGDNNVCTGRILIEIMNVHYFAGGVNVS